MRRLTVVAVSVLACVFGGGAVVRGQNKAPASLHEAVMNGDGAKVKEYIQKNADLNATNLQGSTPLKCAVESYHLDMVKLLLEAGANPNPKDQMGATPLITACNTSQKDAVEMLLASKTEASAKDNTGMTALHWAAMTGQIEIAELLIKAGADVNAKSNSSQTPLMIAQSRGQTAIVDLLKQHGATMPAVQEYGAYGDYGGAAAQAGPAGETSQRPEDFVIDPNAIRKQLAEMAPLQAPLKAVDANSESEQRAWITRRSDNRTTLLRAVQKQFENEMAFVKRVAVEEKAAKTTKAVEDLVAARKKRYERISNDLRDQRRQTMQDSRDSMTTARGGRGATTRGGRGGRSTGTTAAGHDPYGMTTQTRTPRRAVAEVNEPPLDADTRAQIDAWLNTQPEDKSGLLTAAHELDVIEYAALHKSSEEEKAAKTGVSIMALLMLREQRIARIQQKWMEDDERTQKMQERMGPNGIQQGTQPGMQPGTQQGMRRGRR